MIENVPAAPIPACDQESAHHTETPEKKKAVAIRRRTAWSVGAFRFRFNRASFLPGTGISSRPFGIVEAAMLLMMAFIASRALGVVRQTIFNAIFGTGPQANAFYAAFRLPDTLFNLIAGGALSYALIPIFISYEKDRGQSEAWRLVSLVFNLLLVTLTALILLGEFLSPAFVTRFLVPGYPPAEQELVTGLTRIMLVQPLILGLGTIATAVLSSKHRFFLPALSIVIYNFGMIGGLVVSLAVPEVGIYGPTCGVLAAALLQVLVQVPGLRREGLRYSFYWNLRHPGLRQVLGLLGPNALAVGIASVAVIFDTTYASYLSDQASLSALQNALLLFELPVVLFGQAVAQAALPRMTMKAVAGQYVHLSQLTLKVIGGAVLLSVPGVVLLCVLGKPTIHVLFQHGAFTRHSTDLTALALIGYALGLPGSVAGELLARGFYALKDARLPLLSSILTLVARFTLIVLFLKIMARSTYIILAIPLAASCAATASAIFLGLLLFLRLRGKVKLDRGMQRLAQRRKAAARRNIVAPLPSGTDQY